MGHFWRNFSVFLMSLYPAFCVRYLMKLYRSHVLLKASPTQRDAERGFFSFKQDNNP